jgi:ribosome-binding ATPase YchF (GTP1/OBG family)
MTPVAKKQRTGAAERELKAEIKKLKARLAAAEKSAETWKARAKDHKSSAAGSKSELSAVRRSLQKAEAQTKKWKDRAKAALSSSSATPAAPTAAAANTAPVEIMAPSAPTTPDETWTLTALRAEARARKLPGYSRKSKADLLTELRG